MPDTTWAGWIGAPAEDEQELVALGVTLGPRDEASRTWENCRVPELALDRMDQKWGRWIWGLKPDEKPAS